MVNVLVCFHNTKYFGISVVENFLNCFHCAPEGHRSSKVLAFASSLALVTPTIFLGILARIILNVGLVLLQEA